jgi:hypothetical protein
VTRVPPLLTVFAVVLSSGALHGVWTNRWAPSGALERAAARLTDLPMTLGDWDGQADELDARQAAVAGVSGSVLRRYVNRRTGAVVSVLLVCGRPGPVSVHVPEVCYRGAGFEPVGARVKQPAPAGGGEIWACRFQKRSSAGPEEHLRVLYAWNAAGKWEAAEHPRLRFAHCPVLYKFMVVRQMPREDEPLEEDPSVEFLKVLLPASERALSPAQ